MAQELTNLKSQISNLKSQEPMGGWMMLIFWWAMILCALHASTRMVGAGDTWVAMACGRHFINHGVNTVEPFSVNSHKPGPTPQEVKTWPKWAQWITDKVGLDTVKYWHPTGWVNQNWLTHVFFYWLTHDSPVADAETFDKPIEGQNISYNSLVYWKYALYIITIIVVYYTGRVLGANKALSAIFACFALFVGRTFLDIRPAGFSNMLTAVLLFIFVLAVYKNYLYIWLIVPTTVLWCNLHGGYVYVFIALVPFIGLHLLTLLPKKISLCFYYILGWLFLYALSVKFLSHEYLKSISPFSDGLYYFILIAIAVSIAMTVWKNTKSVIFHGYHIITTFVIFIAASSRFFPEGIIVYTRQDPLFKSYVSDGRQTFFIAFIGFVVVAVLLAAFKHRLKAITLKGWWHTVAAAFVAFIAMIIFNPFHLTNLTHTFVVSVGENAKMWKTVNEWHPAFEWSNPVGDEIPFFYMYVAAWVLLVFWVIYLLLKPRIVVKKGKNQVEPVDNQQYAWPLVDLPLLVIAALTVYMAIGSRRFIPVAGVVACPVMAMFVDSILKMMVASRKFIPVAVTIAIIMSFAIIKLVADKIIVLSTLMSIAVIAACLIIAVFIDFCILLFVQRKRMLKSVQYSLIGLTFIAVTFLTVWWGYWYKVVYLDPWPDSDYLTSVFMRMTASYVKPFKACQFVRDNKLSGTVYNYWTEGGFIAYSQFPDPNTGKTHLQLFMDGRAQAAYNTEAYQHWMYIMSGGDPARQAQRANRASYTASDYQAIGDWIDKQLEKENVWVVFMPSAQFNSEVIRGLETSPNWRAVYMDEEQRIYANIKFDRGRKLYLGMFVDQTKFPDNFSKLLTVGYNLIYIQDPNKVKDGCEFIKQAFMQRPSQITALEVINAGSHFPPFRQRMVEIFNQYLNDFIGKKQTYIKQDGYRSRLLAAIVIGDYMARISSNNKEVADKYRKYYNDFTDEQAYINKTCRW